MELLSNYNIMKKALIIMAILALPMISFGAFELLNVDPIEWYDAVGHIKTQDSKDILIYKVEDSGNTCYVSYMNGFTNGMSVAMSCVK